MKITTAFRIVRDSYFGDGLKQSYWKTAALATELRQLLRSGNAAFRGHVRRDFARFAFASVTPVSGQAAERARAAVDWILRAQRTSPDDGVALGYFPCHAGQAAWKPSYPETTGYIITSLLAYADRFGDESVRAAALKMALWEVATQMQSGAVQGGPVCPPERQTAAAFNTGMVLDGWCSVLERAPHEPILAAARKAADWLVADLDEAGYFRTNGAFVAGREIKTYTCLCAWAIYRFGAICGEQRYQDAAVRCIDAALRQQQPNGWFAHNCLVRSEAPLTHTIGYTLQGILEVGTLARRDDYVDAAQKTIAQIIPRISDRGYLPGLFYSDWEPAQFSSCLTGSAQIAIVCYRLFELRGDARHRAAADRLVDYLKALQALDSPLPDINGALAGSFPLFGQYMRGGYPNWATKYLLDALLMQLRLSG